MIFKDRHDAGRQLATKLMEHQGNDNTLLIALPRGGVVVAYEIAKILHLPLDIVCPRKIGAPHNPELAIGAITETGESIFSQELIEGLAISKSYIEKEIEKEKQEAQMRITAYRPGRAPRNLTHQKVIIVDDGLATGSTMQAAIKTVRKEKASSLIIAVPVAPKETLNKIRPLVDELVCLSTPPTFYAVGQFYEHFDQTEDPEVTQLLKETQKTRS